MAYFHKLKSYLYYGLLIEAPHSFIHTYVHTWISLYETFATIVCTQTDVYVWIFAVSVNKYAICMYICLYECMHNIFTLLWICCILVVGIILQIDSTWHCTVAKDEFTAHQLCTYEMHVCVCVLMWTASKSVARVHFAHTCRIRTFTILSDIIS